MSARLDRFELLVRGDAPKCAAEYRQHVQAEWVAAGRPTLGSAPVAVSAMLCRSSNHQCHLIDLLKSLLDPLNGLAWDDDSQLVCLSGIHRRTVPKPEARTILTVWAAGRVTE